MYGTVNQRCVLQANKPLIKHIRNKMGRILGGNGDVRRQFSPPVGESRLRGGAIGGVRGTAYDFLTSLAETGGTRSSCIPWGRHSYLKVNGGGVKSGVCFSRGRIENLLR